MRSTGALLLGLLLLVGSCFKVPIYPVNADFKTADAAWFEEEETLFVFYEVRAEQSLGRESRVEITYTTDEEQVGWTPIEDFPTVHTHEPVDCGVRARCGSSSIAVPLEPRRVRIRLRYHPSSGNHVEADTRFNVVGPGDPHSHRSLVVYGVFDESNEQIQWRGRHQFPTVRNHRATELGLRREFTVTDQGFGHIEPLVGDNPYFYGVDCPRSFVAMDLVSISTDERAVFHPEKLPLGASDATLVCAQSTVTDAIGEFTTGAVARKNPETRSAFPVLHSPVRDARTIKFFLGPCDRRINKKHEDMQRQRLQMEGVPKTCIDDWESRTFVDRMIVEFRDAVEAERPLGDDMVLVIGLHQDDQAVSAKIEAALAEVVPPERHRTSPHLAGAFVFDSTSHGLRLDELDPVTLWCPSTVSLNEIPSVSAISCPTLPDIPDLDLGPFSFGTLPILPAREDYLEFVRDYSERQAGEVTDLEYLAPEFSVTTDHVDLGEFGVVTFLNGETISADQDDAFSYCLPKNGPLFMMRSDLMSNPYIAYGLYEACYYGEVPAELCDFAGLGLIPIEALPEWHNIFGESNYEVGLFWEFPFLLHMDYRAVVAGSVSAFGLSVPFGIGAPSESYYGSQMWTDEEFSLDPDLTQCRRFCDFPTFDSAGVYHVTDPFRTTYANNCYNPRFPVPGDDGFPRDP